MSGRLWLAVQSARGIKLTITMTDLDLCKHHHDHQTARRWFEITLPPLSWELAELSLNSQGTQRLFQPLPTPITNSCIRHCQGTGAHMSLTHTHTGRTQSSGSAPQALYSTLHKCLSQATLRADSRPRSQPTQGYSRSSALSLSGRPDSSASDTQRQQLWGWNTRRCHGRSCALPRYAPWHL